MRTSRQVAYALRSPMLAAYADNALERGGALPRPTTPPQVHARGADPDRILLMGTAAVEGVGVATHELALGGQLARRVSALTGRGVDIDIVGDQTMTAAGCRELLEDSELVRYDALVLLIGAREAIGLQPRTMWRRDLSAILDTVAEIAPATMLTFLVELPHSSGILGLSTGLGMTVDRAVDRLNATTREVVEARPLTRVVPFRPGPLPDGSGYGSAAMHAQWADLIAPSIAAQLENPPMGPRELEPVVETERQRALDRLHILDTPRDERFERIVRMARDGLGVTGAAVNFIDHDRQWTKASVSLGDPGSMERLHAFCSTTIERQDLFVVEDLREDPEFADFPAVTGDLGLRFYAGYPVESPDGFRVGALCVVDTEPRQLSTSDAAMLRDLALRAQDLVWEMAG